MERLKRLQKLLADIFGSMVLILMFIIVIEVCSRQFFNTPVEGGIEISQIILTWILFLPLAYALVQNAHVRVTMVVMHLPPRINLIVEILGNILSVAFIGLITYVGWIKFCESFSVGEVLPATIWLPLWLQKLAVPFGFFLFFIQLCVNVGDQITKLRRCPSGH